jgi:hypothetical protein
MPDFNKTIPEKDKDILNRKVNELVNDEVNYVLNLRSLLEDPKVLEEEQRKDTFQKHPQLIKTKQDLLKAINAASGARKIIEQLFGTDADVSVGSHEKELKRAIKRIFGVNSEVITFEMYKQVVSQMRNIADDIRGKIVDEQSR